MHGETCWECFFFFFLLCQENESILKMIYKESVLQFFDVQGVQNY